LAAAADVVNTPLPVLIRSNMSLPAALTGIVCVGEACNCRTLWSPE